MMYHKVQVKRRALHYNLGVIGIRLPVKMVIPAQITVIAFEH